MHYAVFTTFFTFPDVTDASKTVYVMLNILELLLLHLYFWTVVSSDEKVDK